MELEKLTEAVKKRDKKEDKSGYRMTKKFGIYVGDDTGLLKKVAMSYNYQTDIFGD